MVFSRWFILLWCFWVARVASALSSSSLSSRFQNQVHNNVLILDHLNLNHEKGRHDWLRAFYFDFLGCAVDPRKAENWKRGRQTLWANIGCQQFHLPQGKDDAQVLQGRVTLVYPNMNGITARLEDAQTALEGSQFSAVGADDGWRVTDPWGNQFCLVTGKDRDGRGSQPGDVSEGLGMRDLTMDCPGEANLAGIARFYESILGCSPVHTTDQVCSVSVGPHQTLTFQKKQGLVDYSLHVDLRQGEGEEEEQLSSDSIHQQRLFPSNYGPHISMYVADLGATFDRCRNYLYVNPRFKRRAYTKEQALDQCMFRILDIVDPLDPQSGPILQLEHEIRSCVKVDGTKYKSCPFHQVPMV